MRLTATARLGYPPHPSIALIDTQWLEGELRESRETVPSYIRLSAKDASLGVLRVLDSGRSSRGNVFLDPRAWLSHVPEPGKTLKLENASKDEYVAWRQEHTKLRRWLFWASLGLTVLAGIIELCWNVGKYWDWWYPNDFLAGLSQVAKWAFLGIGVTGLTAYRDYRAIE
jgi:hypothetical protein